QSTNDRHRSLFPKRSIGIALTLTPLLIPHVQSLRRTNSSRGSSMSNTSIIQLSNVTKRYGGFTAVDDIDLEVHTGEIFGILGPNGAGKTTTLEMIEGLREPDSGTIMVNGLDAVKQVDEVRKIIGVQLQSTSLFPFLSAQELMELF